MSEPHPSILLDRSFRDVDELCEATREWDLEFRQLSPGGRVGALFQAQAGPLNFAFAHFLGHLEQRGAPPPGLWTFAVPARGCTPFVWHRKTVESGAILVFRPGMELDAVSQEGFRTFTFSVPEELLNRVAESLGGPGIRRVCPQGGIVNVPSPALRRLEGVLQRAQGALAANNGVAGPTSSSDLLEREIPQRLLGTFRAVHTPATRVTVPPASAWPVGTGEAARLRDRIMARAESLIRTHGREPLTVADLCRAAGANPRTLHRAFTERFGVAPKSYLQACRLNGVHSELLRARAPRTLVADIANRWGFWHMGQFAADYRRMFGELPSRTLARRRPRAGKRLIHEVG